MKEHDFVIMSITNTFYEVNLIMDSDELLFHGIILVDRKSPEGTVVIEATPLLEGWLEENGFTFFLSREKVENRIREILLGISNHDYGEDEEQVDKALKKIMGMV